MHSRVAVLVHEDDARDWDLLNTKLEALMAPYDQQIQVDPYYPDCSACTDGKGMFDEPCKWCVNGKSTEKSTRNPHGKWDYWYTMSDQDQREYVDRIMDESDPYVPVHLLAPELGWLSASEIVLTQDGRFAQVEDAQYQYRADGIIKFASEHGYQVVGVGFHY